MATAVLFSSVFPAMFGTFVKYKFQHTYDAILAAPVDTEELVTGRGAVDRGAGRRLRLRADARRDGLRARTRAGGCCSCRSSASSPGYGWACFGIVDRRRSRKSIENFSYVRAQSSRRCSSSPGTFFPIDELPEWAQVLAQLNPLYHCVQLVRDAVFGFEGWVDVWNLGFLVGFGLVMWRLAIVAMERKLID